jgi:hypothetical protein
LTVTSSSNFFTSIVCVNYSKRREKPHKKYEVVVLNLCFCFSRQIRIFIKVTKNKRKIINK